MGLEFKLTEGICRDRIAPTIMGAIVAKLSKSEWAELRAQAEADGLDDVELSKQWGVSRESIRKRRHDDAQRKDPWLTPREKEKAEAIKAVENFYKGKSNGQGKELVLAPVTDEELVDMRTKTPQELAKHIHGLLRKGIGFLRAPLNIDEYNKMYSLYQKMLGLDKQAGGIAIQINGMAWESGAEKQAEKPVVIMG
jgi:hypothetical protein